tara:strand:- start:1370 stop:1675 length:306 start_codon:yes stop_codon:yes gene_type:complete
MEEFKPTDDLFVSDKDIGKKIYEIEEEITYVIKHQVIAEDEDQAHEKYLDQSKIDIKTESTNEVACSYIKDYSKMNKTEIVGEIVEEIEEDGEKNTMVERR